LGECYEINVLWGLIVDVFIQDRVETASQN